MSNSLLPWLGMFKNARITQHSFDSHLVAVRELEAQYGRCTDHSLAECMSNLHAQFKRPHLNSVQRDEAVQQAAAMGSIAVSRIMGFRLHDVQIIGALATAAGAIIQMNTGEGKTMVCGLAAIIRSVFDSSVHVATTNTYLARRDHQEIESAFNLLGISSMCIGPDSTKSESKTGYRCNITYAPGFVFGFDYLKDQMKIREFESVTLGRNVLQQIHGSDIRHQLVQTGHQSIIVDEADSILIDESTTPLLLSGANDDTSQPALRAFELAEEISRELRDDDYIIHEKTIELTNSGVERIHVALNEHGRLDLIQPWSQYVTNALYARHFLIRDEDYIVSESKIKLVDQNTGRIFDDRALRAGLHQAVEAKEQVQVNTPNQTLARITRQRFFQLYDVIGGMTGTAIGSNAELDHFYHIAVVPIHPNRPCLRIDYPDRFFKDWSTKVDAIIEDVRQRSGLGQPVLIGTRTIRESLLIQQSLTAESVDCQLLNGVQDEQEAELIGKAGIPGQVTIATNMAGRGTDIKLTEETKQNGGLHVIGTQRFESRRVDLQLAGRAARQGDPGSCQFFISATDLLLAEHAPSLARKMIDACDSEGRCHSDFSRQIQRLQDRVEKNGFQQRIKLVQQEKWFDDVRQTVAG